MRLLAEEADEYNPLFRDFYEAFGNLNLNEAKRIARDIVRRWPNYPTAHDHLGDAYGVAGQSLDAIRCYKTALSLNAEDPRACFGLARVLNRLGTESPKSEARGYHQEALALIKKSIHLRGGNAIKYAVLGTTYGYLEQWEDAIHYLRFAIELEPEMLRAWIELGRVCYFTSDWQGAEEAFWKALDLGVEDFRVSHWLSAVLYQQQRYGEAIEYAILALDSIPPDDSQHREPIHWIISHAKEALQTNRT
jgi:tetratricopeptide (TPR) repeat protein